jgi:hypothetical protein
MMYGKGMDQMSSATMRAISKKKPMANAGAKPEEAMPPVKKMAKKRPMGVDYSAAMDRGIRKAMRLPLA